MAQKLFLIICFCWLHLGQCYEPRNLSIAILVPYPSADGGCTRHAIQMGFDDVNNVQDMITYKTNYTFKIQPNFGMTDENDGNAIESQFKLYKRDANPDKIGFLGPPYKDQIDYATEYSTAQANIHISYVDANEPMQPYFIMHFLTPPSIIASFRAARALLERHNWRKASIVYDYSDPRYRKNADNLQEILVNNIFPDTSNTTIKVLTDQGIWSKPTRFHVSAELGVLQKHGSRIIFALVSVSGARKVFCEAYNRKMYKPKVIWILFEILREGWASDKFDAEETKDGFKREINCTEQELLIASDGYIAITKQGLRKDNKRTISKMTADDYSKRLQKLVGPNVKCDENIAYAYDAVWVIATAFSRMSIFSDLTKYKYHNFRAVTRIRTDILAVRFEAITGPLQFNKSYKKSHHNRVGQLSIWSNKVHQGKVFVGTHDTLTGNLSLVPNAQHIFFEEGIIPKDTATYITSYANFALPLLVAMWITAFIGVIIAFLFLVINLVFMHDENITFVSPIMNCIILLGSILCYLSVIIYSIDTRFVSKDGTPYVCYTFLWTISIGFTLTFGSLFAKAWQLYKIYMTPDVKVENNQLEMKDVPEWFLTIIVCAFLLIDVIIMLVWMKVSPFDYQVKNLTKSNNLFEDTINIEQLVGCTCKYETEFTIGMYCYKGVMLIFGLFLAWQTRNANIKTQNDSKQIAMAIYNVVAVSVIGVICVSVLSNTTRYEASYAIVAVCICICTTTTLLLIFVPKIRMIINSGGSEIKCDEKVSENIKPQSPSSKYTLAYMRKNVKAPDMKRGSSTITLTTQASDQQQPQHGESPASTPNGESVPSISYLSSPTFMTPPEYDEKDESKRNVDATGRLSCGIYVGTISEEVEEPPADKPVDSIANQV